MGTGKTNFGRSAGAAAFITADTPNFWDVDDDSGGAVELQEQAALTPAAVKAAAPKPRQRKRAPASGNGILGR